jgi:RNA recognition motif-containing protein
MAKKIYVGNMNYATTEQSLRDLFVQYGEVNTVNIIIDRYTGQAKGFGFVEMANDDHADAAIAALNGTEFEGRSLRVNQAMERSNAPREGAPRRDFRGDEHGRRY